MTDRLTQRHELQDLARALRDAPLVAVDTEFHAERRYLPQIFLLQLNVPDAGIHLLDPLDPEVIPAISEALRSVPWVVHAGKQDLRILYPLLGGIPSEVWDTQIAAGLLSPRYPAGYGDLVQAYLDVDLKKASTLSDWSRRPLSGRQLAYAADDVRLLPALWSALEAQLSERGRMHIAAGACAEAVAAAAGAPDAQELWRGLAAASSLGPAQLAVLRSLCAWREQRAIALNQPARSILGDGLLVDLAKRRPSTIADLLANRRFPKRVAQKLGDELLEQVSAAAASPPDTWPVAVGNQTPADRQGDLIRVAMDVYGAHQGWSRRLVLPDEDIQALCVAADPLATCERRLAAWQWGLVRDGLRGLLDGSHAPAFGPQGATLLELASARS